MYSIIGLCIAGGLLALGLIAILLSGVKGLFSGKQDFKKIGAILLPFVIFGVTFAVSQDYAQAGVLTMVIMLGLMAVTILLTGARTTFNL